MFFQGSFQRSFYRLSLGFRGSASGFCSSDLLGVLHVCVGRSSKGCSFFSSCFSSCPPFEQSSKGHLRVSRIKILGMFFGWRLHNHSSEGLPRIFLERFISNSMRKVRTCVSKFKLLNFKFFFTNFSYGKCRNGVTLK